MFDAHFLNPRRYWLLKFTWTISSCEHSSCCNSKMIVGIRIKLIPFNPCFVRRDVGELHGEGQVGRPCPYSGRHSKQHELALIILICSHQRCSNLLLQKSKHGCEHVFYHEFLAKKSLRLYLGHPLAVPSRHAHTIILHWRKRVQKFAPKWTYGFGFYRVEVKVAVRILWKQNVEWIPLTL